MDRDLLLDINMEEKPLIVRMPHGKGNVLEINGQMYRPKKSKTYQKDGCKHYDYTEFEPFNVDEHNKVLKEVAKKLRDVVPPERVMEELLKDQKTDELKRLSKRLSSGEVVARRHDGCLGVTFVNKKKKKSAYMLIKR